MSIYNAMGIIWRYNIFKHMLEKLTFLENPLKFLFGGGGGWGGREG